jgi:hypothetical protein
MGINSMKKVNDLFFADSYVLKQIDPDTGWPGLLTRAGPGNDKMHKLGIYLNKYMTEKVNRLIATNSTVNARMAKYAGLPDNVMENYGIATWPGAGLSGLEGGERPWRDKGGRADVLFGQVDLTISYHEREIEQIKGSAVFNNPAGAARLMEQYEEMKKAFETNTPSRYKTFSEMWLDGYQPLQKTPPGSLVDQTA